MKKSIIALAAVGAFADAAHAQSTVTLYGIVDEGLNYTSNSKGHPLWNLSSGVMQGSRWGLRGTEDLGGGMKAIFVLESGFDMNNGTMGQGGLLFGRQAYVGLGSRFGTVTLGRQYDSVVDYVGPLEAAGQWGGYIAAHPGDLDNLNNTYRTNNTVKFKSANYAGFKFGGTYSPGGVAGNMSANQIWSLGAGYNNGPLAIGAGRADGVQFGQFVSDRGYQYVEIDGGAIDYILAPLAAPVLRARLDADLRLLGKRPAADSPLSTESG
jgi:predicted porin